MTACCAPVAAARAAASGHVALAGGDLVARQLGGGDALAHRAVLDVDGDDALPQAGQQLSGVETCGGGPVQVDLEADPRVEQLGEHLSAGTPSIVERSSWSWLW